MDMQRDFLVHHLEGCGCYPDGKDNAGEWWVNCVNFEECLIPWDGLLAITTWAQIIYELKVDCPADFDSDFEVFKMWREKEINTHPDLK